MNKIIIETQKKKVKCLQMHACIFQTDMYQDRIPQKQFKTYFDGEDF